MATNKKVTNKEPMTNICNGVRLCDLCLGGRGGICWVPGCLLFMSQSPDIEIRDTIGLSGGEINAEVPVDE